jgi:hypothetical protein
MPGKTTAEEIEARLPKIDVISFPTREQHRKVINVDPRTGLLLDGIYFFNLGAWERPDVDNFANTIHIKDGMVYRLEIQPNQFISLSEALGKLGQPDSIRLFGHPYFFWFHLIYLTERLEVWLVFYKYAESDCHIEDAGSVFWVDSITYHSAESALEPFIDPFPEEEIPQPDLEAYMTDERDVSEAVFQSWLNGDVKETCVEAWESLPKDVVLPTLSPTIEPEATQQP